MAQKEEVKPYACGSCGWRGWIITRQPDCLTATCKKCGMTYDIGWNAKGYES